MIKLTSIFLASLIIFSNSLQAINLNYFTKKNILYTGLIMGTIATSYGIILYKNNLKFRNKVKNIEHETEDFIINNIAVPAIIKWEELKEEGLTKKDKQVLATIGGGTLTLGVLGAILYKYIKPNNP